MITVICNLNQVAAIVCVVVNCVRCAVCIIIMFFCQDVAVCIVCVFDDRVDRAVIIKIKFRFCLLCRLRRMYGSKHSRWCRYYSYHIRLLYCCSWRRIRI